MFVRVEKGECLVPHFQTVIPVSLYVNGRQIPPIETDGEIVNFSLTGLRIRCDKKIPIPAKGIVRFAFGESQERMEMQIEFVHRFERIKRFWLWTKKKEYDFETTFSGNTNSDKHEHYKQHVLHFLYGDSAPYSSKPEEKPPVKKLMFEA